jgi:hypothetical protein
VRGLDTPDLLGAGLLDVARHRLELAEHLARVPGPRLLDRAEVDPELLGGALHVDLRPLLAVVERRIELGRLHVHREAVHHLAHLLALELVLELGALALHVHLAPAGHVDVALRALDGGVQRDLDAGRAAAGVGGLGQVLDADGLGAAAGRTPYEEPGGSRDDERPESDQHG